MRLRDYQQQAHTALTGVYGSGHTRATCVLPCGTGKTIVAASLIKQDQRTVIFVPTIALLAQTLDAISRERATARAVAVCNPTALVRADDDLDITELGTDVTTDVDTLSTLLHDHPQITVIATYASAAVVAEATARTGTTWDTIVCDEAHRTAGLKHKAWGLPLSADAIPATRRLFLTATPKETSAAPDAVDETGEPLPLASMSDAAMYGPLYQPISLREAIARDYLSDYRIAVVAVTEQQAHAAISTAAATVHGEPIDMRTAAAQIALMKYAHTHPGVNACLAFHNSINASQTWAEQWDAVARSSDVPQPVGGTSCTHIDGTTPAPQRREALATLADTPDDHLRVVSNCRVLSEGVDVPALDAVVFAEPRTSAPDIVQIIGRALRLHPTDQTRKAVIIIPVVVPDDDRAALETIVARTPFLAAWQVLTAIAHEDTALYRSLARLRARHEGTENEDPDTDLDPLVEFDFDALTTDVADLFRLRLLRRTTSTWTVLAAELRNHVERGGNVYPRRGYVTPAGVPLGVRTRNLREAYQDGRIPSQVATYVEETVPGWDWDLKASTSRGFDAWCDLIAAHIKKTGVPVIRSFETTTAPNGERVTIGAWLVRQQRRRSALSPHQTERLDNMLGTPWVGTLRN